MNIRILFFWWFDRYFRREKTIKEYYDKESWEKYFDTDYEKIKTSLIKTIIIFILLGLLWFIVPKEYGLLFLSKLLTVVNGENQKWYIPIIGILFNILFVVLVVVCGVIVFSFYATPFIISIILCILITLTFMLSSYSLRMSLKQSFISEMAYYVKWNEEQNSLRDKMSTYLTDMLTSKEKAPTKTEEV